jgi:hypothetical protein
MVHYQLAQLYARLNLPDKQQQHLEIFQKLNAQDRQRRARIGKRMEREMEEQNLDGNR